MFRLFKYLVEVTAPAPCPVSNVSDIRLLAFTVRNLVSSCGELVKSGVNLKLGQ